MPSTPERVVALARNARPTPKGQVVTLDVYVYPNGTSAVRAKGVTGLGHALQCNDDDDLASIVKGIMQEMRDSPIT